MNRRKFFAALFGAPVAAKVASGVDLKVEDDNFIPLLMDTSPGNPFRHGAYYSNAPMAYYATYEDLMCIDPGSMGYISKIDVENKVVTINENVKAAKAAVLDSDDVKHLLSQVRRNLGIEKDEISGYSKQATLIG